MSKTYRVLTGPTASGKTSLLLARANKVPLSIISADSRQVYRGMDIGTGKATAAEQSIAPHYLIDIVNPGAEFSAHHFLLAAAKTFRELEGSRREIWVCGGTGMYIRALTEALPLGRPPIPALRQLIHNQIMAVGPVETADLLKLDLVDKQNHLRVIRAAELLAYDEAGQLLLKQVLSIAELPEVETPAAKTSAGIAPDELEYIRSWECQSVTVLDPGKEALLSRIESRVKGMFDEGLVEECANLRAAGYDAAHVVANGIGYREGLAALDGKISIDAAIESTIIRTRQYAKRQRTFFRGMGWDARDPELVATELLGI